MSNSNPPICATCKHFDPQSEQCFRSRVHSTGFDPLWGVTEGLGGPVYMARDQRRGPLTSDDNKTYCGFTALYHNPKP